MEVLQILGSGAVGGGTTVVLELARELRRRGIDVTIASQTGSYIVERARDSSIPAVELDLSRRAASPIVARRLHALLQGKREIVVHAHGARACLPAALAPEPIRRRLVYTIHGFHYPRKPAGVRQMARRIEQFCVARARETVFVCDYDNRLAIRDGILTTSSGHTRIYNASPPVAHAGGTGEQARFDIAFLGRLHWEKNPQILPEVLLALRPLRPSLLFIGGGDLMEPLRSRVSEAGLTDQVTFLGAVAYEQALVWLRRSRVMVLPSLSEGLSLAVIEAMQSAMPVVASAVGGTPELIRHGHSGFLVSEQNPTQYAGYIKRLLTDDTARREMGCNAMHAAAKQFCFDDFVEAHLALYRRLAGGDVQQRPAA